MKKPYIPPHITLISHPSDKVKAAREAVTSVLARYAKETAGDKRAIILSGGLDTSIVAEALHDSFSENRE